MGRHRIEANCPICSGPRGKLTLRCDKCRIKQVGEIRKRSLPLFECPVCKIKVVKYEKYQETCNSCRWKYQDWLKIPNTSYKYVNFGLLSNDIARRIVGSEQLTKKNVHHFDFDRSNNSLDNLIILSVKDHPKLHLYLASQIRKAAIKGEFENTEENWKSFIKYTTMQWFVDNDIEYTLLSEIK